MRELLSTLHDITVSVSHTTRPKRPGEEHGVHYYFVTRADFMEMMENGAFLEHAKVFDNFYGTSQRHVDELLISGKDVILEIDWQGADQVRRLYPDCVSIFILPPTRKELRSRLAGRGTDNEEVIERRMRDAVSEMSHYGEYDYLLVNDTFDLALEELRAIIVGGRLTIIKQEQRLQGLLTELLG